MTERMLLARPVGGCGTDRMATVVAALTDPRDIEDIASLARRSGAALAAQVRADLIGDIDPVLVRRDVAGPLIYSLRTVEYGGSSSDLLPARWLRLRNAAARGFDLVEVEFDRDATADVLDAIAPDRRLVSWYGPAADVSELRKRLAEMSAIPAAMYLLMVPADSFEAALQPLQLLATLDRDDVTAFGVGPAAAFGRVLAPWLGAPVVFGGPDGPTVRELLADYHLPQLPSLDALYGIVSRSLGTSQFLSQVNAAFRELGQPYLFLPFVVADEEELTGAFFPALRADGLGLPVRGLTVAAPYKPAALAASDSADPSARAAHAANLMLRSDQRWRAATTDGTAMVAALRDQRPLEDGRVAVVGCGAAGRAAAYELAAAGARVTLVNRDWRRGRYAADLLGLPVLALEDFQPGRYEVIVHATPAADTPLFDLDRVAPHCVIADFVCAAHTTDLIAAAGQRGLATVDGHEVLAHEVEQQFRRMAGQPMPMPHPL